MRLKYGLLKERLQVKVKQNYGRVFWIQNTIMQSSGGERGKGTRKEECS